MRSTTNKQPEYGDPCTVSVRWIYKMKEFAKRIYIDSFIKYSVYINITLIDNNLFYVYTNTCLVVKKVNKKETILINGVLHQQQNNFWQYQVRNYANYNVKSKLPHH